jgi:SAM-dependent methyltransferase
VGAEGGVYAIELGAEDRAAIAEAASELGAERGVVHEAQIAATGLPPGSFDAALMRGVYHHLTEPKAMAESLFATIRSGGRLLIIDFPPNFWLVLWTPDSIPEDRGGHGISLRPGRPRARSGWLQANRDHREMVELRLRDEELCGGVRANVMRRHWRSLGPD